MVERYCESNEEAGYPEAYEEIKTIFKDDSLWDCMQRLHIAKTTPFIEQTRKLMD